MGAPARLTVVMTLRVLRFGAAAAARSARTRRTRGARRARGTRARGRRRRTASAHRLTVHGAVNRRQDLVHFVLRVNITVAFLLGVNEGAVHGNFEPTRHARSALTRHLNSREFVVDLLANCLHLTRVTSGSAVHDVYLRLAFRRCRCR